MAETVYQRGWVINSQLDDLDETDGRSISKGMGDQFSASADRVTRSAQYIKGDG